MFSMETYSIRWIQLILCIQCKLQTYNLVKCKCSNISNAITLYFGCNVINLITRRMHRSMNYPVCTKKVLGFSDNDDNINKSYDICKKNCCSIQ